MTAYLLLYVDDIILTTSSPILLNKIIAQLHTEFSMKDLGHLHHFLGISVSLTPTTLHLSQRQYILDILNCAGMTDCNPAPRRSGSSSPATQSPFIIFASAGSFETVSLTINSRVGFSRS